MERQARENSWRWLPCRGPPRLLLGRPQESSGRCWGGAPHHRQGCRGQGGWLSVGMLTADVACGGVLGPAQRLQMALGLKVHQPRRWDKGPWMGASAGSRGPQEGRARGTGTWGKGMDFQRSWAGLWSAGWLPAGAWLWASAAGCGCGRSMAVGHILPSRSPCRLFLCLSARPHLEAAWTARGGWGTPGGAVFAGHVAGKRAHCKSTGCAVRPAPPKQRPRRMCGTPKREQFPWTRGRLTSLHTHRPRHRAGTRLGGVNC